MGDVIQFRGPPPQTEAAREPRVWLQDGEWSAMIPGISCAGCGATPCEAMRNLAIVLGDFVRGRDRRIVELTEE